MSIFTSVGSGSSVTGLLQSTPHPQQVLKSVLDSQIGSSKKIVDLVEQLARFENDLPDGKKQAFRSILSDLIQQGVNVATSAQDLAKAI